ncbi:hypothetical protein IT414_01770 [bacterium]|nr:hypothetical protein [bacterium]
MITQLVAIFACILLMGLAFFQALLALGYPHGEYAWGGQHKILPYNLRAGSVFAICTYIFFILIALNQSSLLRLFSTQGWTEYCLIGMTVYLFIGVGVNAISRSRPERYTMTPIAATLALLFLYLVLNT